MSSEIRFVSVRRDSAGRIAVICGEVRKRLASRTYPVAVPPGPRGSEIAPSGRKRESSAARSLTCGPRLPCGRGDDAHAAIPKHTTQAITVPATVFRILTGQRIAGPPQASLSPCKIPVKPVQTRGAAAPAQIRAPNLLPDS
jgi:hypothetical protein